MKIIKHGEIPAERLWRGTCSTCSTQVEFKQSEGKYIDDQRDGDCVQVTCPACNKPIFGSRVRP